MGRCEFILVHIARIQCLVRCKQPAGDDMAEVENVGLMAYDRLGYGR